MQSKHPVCREMGADLFKSSVKHAVRWLISLFQLSFTAPSRISSFQRMCESEPVDTAGSSLETTQNTIVRYCFSVRAKLFVFAKKWSWLTDCLHTAEMYIQKDAICGHRCGCNRSQRTKWTNISTLIKTINNCQKKQQILSIQSLNHWLQARAVDSNWEYSVASFFQRLFTLTSS